MRNRFSLLSRAGADGQGAEAKGSPLACCWPPQGRLRGNTLAHAGLDQAVLRANLLRPYGGTDKMVVLPGRDQALVRFECGQGRMHQRRISFTIHQGREVLSLLFTHRFSFPGSA